MLLDKQFLACSMGYKTDKEIHDPNIPERVLSAKLLPFLPKFPLLT